MYARAKNPYRNLNKHVRTYINSLLNKTYNFTILKNIYHIVKYSNLKTFIEIKSTLKII